MMCVCSFCYSPPCCSIHIRAPTQVDVNLYRNIYIYFLFNKQQEKREGFAALFVFFQLNQHNPFHNMNKIPSCTRDWNMEINGISADAFAFMHGWVLRSKSRWLLLVTSIWKDFLGYWSALGLTHGIPNVNKNTTIMLFNIITIFSNLFDLIYTMHCLISQIVKGPLCLLLVLLR